MRFSCFSGGNNKEKAKEGRKEDMVSEKYLELLQCVSQEEARARIAKLTDQEKDVFIVVCLRVMGLLDDEQEAGKNAIDHMRCQRNLRYLHAVDRKLTPNANS